MGDGTIWLRILEICGGIITILAAIKGVASMGTTLSGPYLSLKHRMDAAEIKLEKHDEFFNNDKRKIQMLEADLSVIMKAQFAILNHICGTKENTGQVESALAELQNYLTTKGVRL